MIKLFEEYVDSTEFNSLIFESEKKSLVKTVNPNIIFVTKNPHGLNSTGEFSRFRTSAEKYNVNIYAIDVDKIKYKLSNDKMSFIIDDIGTFPRDNTIFFFRHAVKLKSDPETRAVTMENVKKLKKLLKSNGYIMSNSDSVSRICKNKYRTFETLNKNGVSTINTLLIDQNVYNSNHLDGVNAINSYIKTNGMSLPVVVKIVDGTQGNGVFQCKDEQILSAIVSYLIRKEGRCIIQPFCEINNDVRVHVFCKSLHPETANVEDFEVVGTMKREKAENDFRTNFSLGGQISKYKLSKPEEELAKQAAKAVGAIWCGVDLCHDNITKKDYIIEVNSSPALKGISQVAEIPPTDLMVKRIKEQLSGKVTETDMSDRELVSYYETVELDGIAIKGMFDTGNSAMCAIKSDHFEIEDDKVTFRLGDQIVTKDIIRKKKILHGGIQSDKRPVVKFDINFNGKVLKDVEVCVRGLTDIEKERKKKGEKFGNKILLTTKVINDLKLIVHPNRDVSFIKTKKV